VSHEGLNIDDPGVILLGQAVADVPPNELLLVCSGPLPGLRPGVTRLITDVRERPHAGERCLPLTLPSAAALSASPGTYAAAVVWPRAHLGKDFSLLCLARGALALRPGGGLFCAARKDKGGASLAAAIEQMMGHVEVLERSRGYHLYHARRGEIDRDAALRHLSARYELHAPLVSDAPLASAPGVFCRRHLDDGTRALLEHLSAAHHGQPRHIVDLCAGIGPIALWAAKRWPSASILAVESNLLACDLIVENSRRAGVDAQIRALASDGLPATPTPTDLLLANPPTHAGEDELGRLLAPLPRWLSPGDAWFVVNRPGRLVSLLTKKTDPSPSHLDVIDVPGFALVHARWGA
jgi:16S rRNA G1207 methylase RsmC